MLFRRVDVTTAKNDFAPGAGGDDAPALPERDASRASYFEDDLLGQRLRDDPQIGALHRRAQITDGGRAAPALARGRLMVADTFLARAIEIVIAWETQLHRALDEGLADRVPIGNIGDAERPIGPVERVGTPCLVLGTLEIGQHVLERPPGVAELTPMIEILGLAADIDHTVDRGGAAEHLAARPENAAIAGAGVGLGLVAPVDGRIGEGLAKAEGDMDPAVAVLAPSLDQQDTSCRVLAEPGRHRATGRPRTDNDKIGLDQMR